MHENKQVCLNIFFCFLVFESFLNKCRQSYEALVPLNFRHQLPCSPEINALVPLNPPKGSNSLRY